MVHGGVIIVITLLRYGLRWCYFFFITLLHYYHTGQDISLFVIMLLRYCRRCYYFFRYLLLRCYAIAGGAIIFFVILPTLFLLP